MHILSNGWETSPHLIDFFSKWSLNYVDHVDVTIPTAWSMQWSAIFSNFLKWKPACVQACIVCMHMQICCFLCLYAFLWIKDRISCCVCTFPGKDATDDFEDVGHSDNARDMLKDFYVGEIDASTIPKKTTYTPPKQPYYNQDKTSEFIVKLLQFLVPIAILGLAFGIRLYTKSS